MDLQRKLPTLVSHLFYFFYRFDKFQFVGCENLMIIRGERKIWYGVSGEDGGDFDKIVKEMVPELFEHQPDLLHHITTIFNPRVLMQKVFIISFH